MMRMSREAAALCEILRDAGGAAVPEEAIAASLAVPISAVRGVVRLLEEEGFVIDTSRRGAYSLVRMPEYDLSLSCIGSLLRNAGLRSPEVFLFETLRSTQETAREIGRGSSAGEVVVFSEEQSGGRGRRDRSWISPKGAGLFFSVFHRPEIAPGRVQLISLAAGLAVRDAVKSLFSLELSLKWPNDLLREGKKACGILVEASSIGVGLRDCRTGIGINIRRPATACAGGDDILKDAFFLCDEVSPVYRGELAVAILQRFFDLIARLEADGGRSLLSLYRDACFTLGREVTVIVDEGAVQGRAIAVGENGELVVSTKNGEMRFCAADVIHATPASHKGACI